MKQIIIISVVGLVFVGMILLVIDQQNKANMENIEKLMTVTQINADSQTDVKACSKDWLCATTSLLSGLGGMFSIVK